VHIVL